jgi:ubiquinone/menaquinone biosynthesis C-methylase UbiE
MQCIFCNAKTDREQMCHSCKSDPFKVEKFRQILAKKSDLLNLKNTYMNGYASFENINSPDMWDFYMKYHTSVEKDNKTTIRRIKQTIRLLPHNIHSILDIGVGYAFLYEAINKSMRNVSLAGVDISGEAIQNIKQKIVGDFRVGSADMLPWEDNRFDTVLMLETLEHIPVFSLHKVLSEARRVLNDDGYLIVSVPVYEKLETCTFKCPVCKSIINPNGHVRAYTPELIQSELKMANFVIKDVKKIWPESRIYPAMPVLNDLYTDKFKPINVIVKCTKEQL